MSAAAIFALVSLAMCLAAWLGAAMSVRVLGKVKHQRKCLSVERIQGQEEFRRLESLRLDLLDQRAWLDENEVRYVLRQDLPRCDLCGNTFRQVGPKDFTHTFCPAQ